MKPLSFFILILGLLSSAACRQDDELPEPSPEAPQEGISGPKIELSEPKEMEEFGFGDTIRVSGQIEHIFTLHEYLFQIEDVKTGEILLQEVEHIHSGRRIELEKFWVHQMEEGGELRLIFRANDHGDLFSNYERQIRCLPR
jgi:hypothetical protein